MKAPDLFDLAARNLRESILRNSLTTLGIAVGVASLVAMLALGVGLQQMAGARLSRSGLFDTVVVFSRRDISSFDRAERRRNPSPTDARRLDPTAREEMGKLTGVAEVYPEIRFPTEVRFDEKSHFTTIAGLPLSARSNEAFDTLVGSFFSADEAQEAILQEEFARSLNEQTKDLVGKELILRYFERVPMESGDISLVRSEKKLRIIGVVEEEPFGGMRSFARGRVFLPNALAEKLNPIGATGTLRDALRDADQGVTYQSLLVRVNNPAEVQGIQDTIKKMGFTTWSMLDATRSLRRFFAVVDLFLGIFGSLALAVASLGIINTLVMAILERRREIGIMKAVGASDGDVKKLFFVEAGVMGLMGGIFGVIVGWIIGAAINFGTGIYLERQELPPERVWSAPWWLVLGAIGFSIVVSLLAGLYPASRAAKLDPVQALRYE